MPAHKNQHFVPRCALKPFTLHAEGLAINVFNIARNRPIQNAPVKSQCARTYLYGIDLQLEKSLVQLEGEYARIVGNLSTGRSLDEEDHEWLHLFAIMQFRRTARAIEEMREFTERMADVVFKKYPEQREKDERTDTDLMIQSLKMAFEGTKYVTDLKCVVLRNQSNVDFVISDNPLVMTNRFYIQRMNATNFGLANSGAILAMPVSPKLCVIWYDRGVYTVPNASGTSFVEIKADDVAAINAWQYLYAQSNIYFARWDDRAYIQEQIENATPRRAEAKPRATLLVRDHAAPGESYRRGTAEEEAAAKETLVLASQNHPRPSVWPSQIKFRSKPKTYSDGSAVGHVRSAELLRRGG